MNKIRPIRVELALQTNEEKLFTKMHTKIHSPPLHSFHFLSSSKTCLCYLHLWDVHPTKKLHMEKVSVPMEHLSYTLQTCAFKPRVSHWNFSSWIILYAKIMNNLNFLTFLSFCCNWKISYSQARRHSFTSMKLKICFLQLWESVFYISIEYCNHNHTCQGSN